MQINLYLTRSSLEDSSSGVSTSRLLFTKWRNWLLSLHTAWVFSVTRGVYLSPDLGLSSLDSGLQGVCWGEAWPEALLSPPPVKPPRQSSWGVGPVWRSLRRSAPAWPPWPQCRVPGLGRLLQIQGEGDCFPRKHPPARGLPTETSGSPGPQEI